MSNRSRVPKLILIIFLTVLLLILVLQNLNPATIHLLFWKIENLPVIAIVLITLVLGYSLGLLTYTLIFRGKDKAERVNQKEKEKQDKLEKKIKEKQKSEE